MASQFKTTQGSTPSFDEFDVVRLRYDTANEGVIYLAGSKGAIVYIHEGFDAYEVEFSDPQWAVLTLGVSDIVPVDEPAA